MGKSKLNLWIGIILIILGSLQFLNFGILSSIAAQVISRIAPLVMIIVGVYMAIKG